MENQHNIEEADLMTVIELNREREEYLKRQNQALKEMTYKNDKEEAMNNLVQSGIITKKGNLKKVYK